MAKQKKEGGKKPESMQKQLSKMKIWQLVLALILVVGGVVLFVGAVGGWFGGAKVTLDVEYYCEEECDGEYMNISGEEYEKLIEEKKSFVVFVDQTGCNTADKVREYMSDYAKKMGVRVYKIMFDDARETSLHDTVKYYPSVAIISKGKVVGFLRADSDEDSDAYNKYEAFEEWIKRYL